MATCPQCGSAYPRHIQICPRDGTLLDDEPPGDGLVGRTLDAKYRIDSRLGEGGMGTVYRATHLMLGKAVALKVIRPELVTSKEVVRRFQREARAASALSHPGIATVHDLGQTEDGMLYIAMEFVEGPTLKDLLARGPLAPDRIVRILRQMIDALAVAHERQIIHRDLKPQNIVLRKGPAGRETATLLDFGIAKTFDESAATRLTSTGIAIGTPQYMSPEQASAIAVDPRSDVYSLGVVLYEMLTGMVPFAAPNALALLFKHVHESPEPPSRRRPDLGIPASLEAITLRCLEKTPEGRYQSVNQLGDALDAAGEMPRRTAPEPVPAPAPPPPIAFAPSPAKTMELTVATELVHESEGPIAPPPPKVVATILLSERPAPPALSETVLLGERETGEASALAGPSADLAVSRQVSRRSAALGTVAVIATAVVLLGLVAYQGDVFGPRQSGADPIGVPSPTPTPTTIPAPTTRSDLPATNGIATKTYTVVFAKGRTSGQSVVERFPVVATAEGESVAITALSTVFSFSQAEDPGDFVLNIKLADKRIQLAKDQPLVMVDGRVTSLTSPARRDDQGAWSVPIDFIPRAIGPAIGERIEIDRLKGTIRVGDAWPR